MFLRKITRGATGTDIPMLSGTQVHRGDILTLTGRVQDTTAAAKAMGFADRPSDVADVAFIGAGIAIGALVGALTLKVGTVPLTLSTAGGALIAGLVCGWLRSVHPTLRTHPAGRGVVHELGRAERVHRRRRHHLPGRASWRGCSSSASACSCGASSRPRCRSSLGMFIGNYVFRFHPAILLGAVAGARTTTAALGMVCEAAKSQVPALGYTVTYAVGNTLLTIWGMVIVMLLM